MRPPVGRGFVRLINLGMQRRHDRLREPAGTRADLTYPLDLVTKVGQIEHGLHDPDRRTWLGAVLVHVLAKRQTGPFRGGERPPRGLPCSPRLSRASSLSSAPPRRYIWVSAYGHDLIMICHYASDCIRLFSFHFDTQVRTTATIHATAR